MLPESVVTDLPDLPAMTISFSRPVFIGLVIVPMLLLLFILPLQVIYQAGNRRISHLIAKRKKDQHDHSPQEATKKPLRRWRDLLNARLRFHPPVQQRVNILKDATPLFHISNELSLLTGWLLSLMLLPLVFVILISLLLITQLTEVIIWAVTPSLVSLPNTIDRPLLAVWCSLPHRYDNWQAGAAYDRRQPRHTDE